MKENNLKALLLTAFCFVVALCSEIKSMDTASDFQETTFCKAKNTNSEGCLDSLKTEISSNSYNVLFLLNQDENKDPKTSWASYMASPFKTVIHGTYNIVDFAVKHPAQTIITSLLVAAQFTAVAADCNCIYYIPGSGSSCTPWAVEWAATPGSLGQFQNASACQQLIQTFANSNLCYYGCF